MAAGGRAVRSQPRPAPTMVAILVMTLLAAACATPWRTAARAAAHALIVEDALRPAAAIVVLQGAPAHRDREAAALYRAGWAPRVVISRDGPSPSMASGLTQGTSHSSNHDISVQVLRAHGVPDGAIAMMERTVHTTAEELEQVYAAVGPGAEPMILVSSPVHTRRVSLLWNAISRGRRPAIARPTNFEPFEPDGWWGSAAHRNALLHEYLGLVKTALIPLARQTPCRPPDLVMRELLCR